MVYPGAERLSQIQPYFLDSGRLGDPNKPGESVTLAEELTCRLHIHPSGNTLNTITIKDEKAIRGGEKPRYAIAQITQTESWTGARTMTTETRRLVCNTNPLGSIEVEQMNSIIFVGPNVVDYAKNYGGESVTTVDQDSLKLAMEAERVLIPTKPLKEGGNHGIVDIKPAITRMYPYLLKADNLSPGDRQTNIATAKAVLNKGLLNGGRSAWPISSDTGIIDRILTLLGIAEIK